MTYYQVNLSDVAENYRTISTRTDALVVPMLKANAYGLGAQAVLQTLMEEGVRTFAVSRLEEALDIETEGARIWCLSCYHSERDLQILIDHDFVLAADSLSQCETISRLAAERGKTATVHIAVDSGFGRFGFAPDNTDDIVRACALPGIQAEGIFSHLGSAFFLKDDYADRQLQAFLNTVERLAAAGQTFSIKHIANSSAFVRDKKFHLDAVRIGSALCGRLPVYTELPLKRVGHLYSEILDIRPIGKGHFVGYGKVYRTKRPTQVAVLAAGSSDGVQMRKDYDTFRFRDLCRYGFEIFKMMLRRDNRMHVKIGEYSAPVLGRVALSHTMVDVTGLSCKVGDRAEIPISPLQVGAHVERRYE